MAVDSKSKRFSATQLLVPSYTQSAVPSGTISRPAAAWVYMGITIAGRITGLMTMAFSVAYPETVFSVTLPEITFTGIGPAMTFTGSDT